MLTSDRPGLSESTASSSFSVTSRALAPGSFSTTISSPGPSVNTASPMSGWWSSTTVATSDSRWQPSPPALPPHPPSMVTLARSSGV